MKRIYIAMCLTAVLSVMPMQSAHAEKEAGEAGKLASKAASVVEKTQTDEIEDVRVTKLRAWLGRYNSPMANNADTFVKEADKYGLDWRLVPSIAGVESTFGQFIPRASFNPFGWGVFTGKDYGVAFHDWDEAISSVSAGLKENYIDKGATTLEGIGYRYAASSAWTNHVRYFMKDLDNFTPPPQQISQKAVAMTL